MSSEIYFCMGHQYIAIPPPLHVLAKGMQYMNYKMTHMHLSNELVVSTCQFDHSLCHQGLLLSVVLLSVVSFP